MNAQLKLVYIYLTYLQDKVNESIKPSLSTNFCQSSKELVMEQSEGIVKAQGLGLVIAAVFLAGEMAGGGVLALAKAMVNTGPAGLAFIVFFALNTAFVGTRLGLCWVILEERFPYLREQVRIEPILRCNVVCKICNFINT